MMKNEIVLYRPNELAEHIEVRVDEETVWLNRQQLSTLFNRDIKTIGKHINNVFAEGELDEKATVAKFATVQNEGGRMVERQLEYYNLDVIISVGYHVKSKQGTQFRIWANKFLQYGQFKLKTFVKSHDRFLIIDGKEVYHLGASLKDLGKKPVVSEVEPWFAFSKMDKSSVEGVLNSILELI